MWVGYCEQILRGSKRLCYELYTPACPENLKDTSLLGKDRAVGPEGCASTLPEEHLDSIDQTQAIPAMSSAYDHEILEAANPKHFTKLLRQLKKSTDQAISRRIQWTQELDRNAHSRNVLRNSTTELMSLLKQSYESREFHPQERLRAKGQVDRAHGRLHTAYADPTIMESPPTTVNYSSSTIDSSQTICDSGIGSSQPEFAGGDRKPQHASDSAPILSCIKMAGEVLIVFL